MDNADALGIHARLVLRSARSWHQARLQERPLQAALFRLLAPSNLAILAPVFDSLLRLFEIALGRPMIGGGLDHESADEHLLLSLLAGARTRAACLSCNPAAARNLHCAVCSVRIMLNLASRDWPLTEDVGARSGAIAGGDLPF
ncbi:MULTISPECIES: hypothetical protein [unclassified Sphingomonas]|nr:MULTISPECIES: hypothetical protein [unclassified Sphingomonas]